MKGWVYLLLGAVMIGYVEFIESRTEEGSLVFFFWVAVLLILYGLGKEAIVRFSSRPEKKEQVGPPKRKEHPHDHKHPGGNQFHGRSHHESHKHIRPHGHRHESHPKEKGHVECPRCHSTNPSKWDNCHHCGFQLSH